MTREPSAQARRILADIVRARGPGWRNCADSIRDGGRVNDWCDAALVAIDVALRTERDDDD